MQLFVSFGSVALPQAISELSGRRHSYIKFCQWIKRMFVLCIFLPTSTVTSWNETNERQDIESNLLRVQLHILKYAIVQAVSVNHLCLFITRICSTCQMFESVQGYRLLWTGMGAQLARDVPFSAICWLTLEPVSFYANEYSVLHFARFSM